MREKSQKRKNLSIQDKVSARTWPPTLYLLIYEAFHQHKWQFILKSIFTRESHRLYTTNWDGHTDGQSDFNMTWLSPILDFLYSNGGLSLNVIYFTTITTQVIQLILIMLVGTDVWVPVVFVWEETGVPGGNPPVWLGDHMTISHDGNKSHNDTWCSL